MWDLDYKESWAPKSFWSVVLEKTLERPLDRKEIQPVHPKGDQSWVFIGRTDVEAETPILWPPEVKSWLIWKDPDAGKDWGQEEKGPTEDAVAGRHHRLSGHESEWAPGAGAGPGSLLCCGPCGRKESDTTEQLNWTVLSLQYLSVSIPPSWSCYQLIRGKNELLAVGEHIPTWKDFMAFFFPPSCYLLEHLNVSCRKKKMEKNQEGVDCWFLWKIVIVSI